MSKLKRMNTKTFVFIHTPKTAGTTIHSVLNKEYKKQYYIRGNKAFKDVARFKKFSETKKNSFDIIRGHLSILTLPELKDFQTLTFFRDPLDYFLSDFYYIKRSPKNRLYPLIKDMDDPEEFLDLVVKVNYDNIQTRHLSASINEPIDLERIDFSKHGEEYLKKAIKNVDSFDYVFFTQQFDLAMLLLEKELNWPKRPFYNLRNQGKKPIKKSDLSEAFVSKFNEAYRYDIQLVEFAKQKNQELIKDKVTDQEIDKFRQENKAYQEKSWNRINDLYIKRIQKKLNDYYRDVFT